MSIVVSMSTYNTDPGLLDRAVSSVLDQKDADLRLLVVNDAGERAYLRRVDSRVVVHEMPKNRGTYFIADAVTRAISCRPELLWKPHDSDDWSEPTALETLRAALVEGAAVAPLWSHTVARPEGRIVPLDRERVSRTDPTTHFPWWRPLHRAAYRAGLPVRQPSFLPWHCPSLSWCSGLYSSERLQLAGGIRPDFRVGYDVFFLRMLASTGPVGFSDNATYHHDRTNSRSLTASPASGSSSRYREKEVLRAVRMMRAAYRDPSGPSRYIRTSIPEEYGEAVEKESAEIRSKIL